MKLLITGAAGQLGKEILRQLEKGGSVLGPLPVELTGVQVKGVDLADADLSSLEETRKLLASEKPDVVINCAAYTNVDGCETNWDTAFQANSIGPRNLAMACEELGAKLVHISTDYVFSGVGETPFSEASLPAPCSAYGRSKFLGEEYIRQFSTRWFVVRTAWLYGREGKNFVKTILRVAKEKGQLKVVDDQYGNPTNAEDLAHHLLCLAATEEYGVYHCTGEGICSWYDFASSIVSLAGIEAKVEPCSTEEFNSPTQRPAYSALDHSMLRATVGDKMRPWREALEDYIKQNKENLV